ncbi:MAG: flagellar protein [Oceanospirillaceae bacterium]|uniref:flagellar basal body-associated FliL family protein n=1 Tax=unclassified Thalassolituus TaxID=2624967 RepID=UPI000C418B7F|nr:MULTISPECIES: flagellar basal body-associated FliL family protein [unclassified Thalassolituus]MAX99203.1 flagellar protein [Oceanospirillaceae bacterium]MBL33708.1 flagellar protein [Oceanospirillaceae bacterium]MBS51706.1 flagellar protein [Oceanospirillaceae bacterium]|tara:strand:+ start:1119 stop:1661 length:543 start_codon:yes stop_codon:yes gene_type:complete
MAAEQDLKLDGGAEGEEGSSGGGKKKLIIIIIAVLLLLGGGAGAAYFFLFMGDDEAAAEEGAEAVEEVVEEPEIPAQYIILKPEFVVSFQVGTRQRFLQANIEVMTRKQTIADALTLHEPMIRSNIIRILGEQDFNALRTPEGRIALQDELTAALAQIIKRETGQSDGVEAVLFTDFVMQ